MSEVTPPAFPDGEIDLFMRRRVCARCYGDLIKRPAPDRLWYAVCPVCEASWRFATLSRWVAEERGERAVAELAEVRQNLPDLFPNPHRGKAPQKLMQELGF